MLKVFLSTILLSLLLIVGPSIALKCHSCYAMGSDRLDNCTLLPITSLREKIQQNPALATFDAFDRPTICLKVTMTLEGPGQKLYTVIRVGASDKGDTEQSPERVGRSSSAPAGQPPVVPPEGQGQLGDFRDECLSKTRRAGDFMVIYQICGCDSDFCNGQPNLRVERSLFHFPTIFGLSMYILVTTTMGP